MIDGQVAPSWQRTQGAQREIFAFTTARLASHDLGTLMKWPKMSMHDETARRPDGMVTMHVSCKRIDHQSTQSDGMPCMMHDPRQPLETPNFRYDTLGAISPIEMPEKTRK